LNDFCAGCCSCPSWKKFLPCGRKTISGAVPPQHTNPGRNIFGCSVDSLSRAYLMFRFADSVEVPHKFEPEPADLPKIPQRKRPPPQEPILVVNQPVKCPQLIATKARPNILLGKPILISCHPTLPRKHRRTRRNKTSFDTFVTITAQCFIADGHGTHNAFATQYVVPAPK
jgi:hypothetical protein